MTKKQYTHALSHKGYLKPNRLRALRSLMRSHQIKGISCGILLPAKILIELEEYIQRNSLVEKKDLPPRADELDGLCIQCCKEHALKLASIYKLNSKARQYLVDIFEGKAGHSGYYLDRNNMHKIPSYEEF